MKYPPRKSPQYLCSPPNKPALVFLARLILLASVTPNASPDPSDHPPPVVVISLQTRQMGVGVLMLCLTQSLALRR